MFGSTREELRTAESAASIAASSHLLISARCRSRQRCRTSVTYTLYSLKSVLPFLYSVKKCNYAVVPRTHQKWFQRNMQQALQHSATVSCPPDVVHRGAAESRRYHGHREPGGGPPRFCFWLATPSFPGFSPPFFHLMVGSKNYLKRPQAPSEVFDPTIISSSYCTRTPNALRYHVIMDPPVRNSKGGPHPGDSGVVMRGGGS